MNSSVQYIETYLAELQQTVAQLPAEQINQVVDILLNNVKSGGKVFMCGNGGSASTASHFACDLAKNTVVSGAPHFKVIALTDNMALVTAWSNDTAYDHVFSAQLDPLVQAGDVVIGISCSGNSQNVINAMDIARQHRATTIAFTGDTGGRLKDVVDLCIQVPSPRIEQQEDVHLILEHSICAAVRDRLRQEPQSVSFISSLQKPVAA
jgi:D-sedoheptulose 7-phosphate isomerase